MTFQKRHLCAHDKLKGSSNNFFSHGHMSLELARISSQNNYLSKKHCPYFRYTSFELLWKVCQVPISTWLRKRISDRVSDQSAGRMVTQTFSSNSVLTFSKKTFNIGLYLINNLQFKKPAVSKFGDMGKSLPYALPHVILSAECYFWWYSKICQIWKPQISGTHTPSPK